MLSVIMYVSRLDVVVVVSPSDRDYDGSSSQVAEREENVDQRFPNPEMTSSKVLFCPQPTDIQFTVLKIVLFKKLESENSDLKERKLNQTSQFIIK